jgi:branched-subunit amino acid transport protein
MTDVWLTIAALALTTMLIRASGPLLMGSRELPARFSGVIDLLGPAILTALIAVETLGGDREIDPSASLVGVAAAAGVLLRRRSALLTAIIVAAAATAAVRGLG